MNQNKLSSRVYTLIKSAAAAAALPIFLVYIMIAKPDYRIMNAAAHVVVPVASAVGDAITWPVRVVGRTVANIHELSTLRAENEELRARLDAALENKIACDIAIAENQKLALQLDIVRASPQRAVLAGVTYDNRAFHHSTFLINKGTAAGIQNGMAVVSMDGTLVGMVVDTGHNFAKVRSLSDAASNIAVRIAGSEVYGFLTGNGSRYPTMGFFSDPEFQPRAGLHLVTSNISGILPGGIPVGEMTSPTDVKTLPPSRLSSVMVLQFDNGDKYK
ncbi:MAG: rod shape-determining protein MreC [Alphaproteobacteria bacterium]|nr:rod shape-determining protein MreC [Alphaproteobacteria bacterium]MDE6571261.1 rod shape-determining protein MreC [Alphaproteobacteria bacterium]